MDELVSVVITTYKRPIDILERAVKSVLAQTYSNLELFVINDAPQEKALVDEIRVRLEKLKDPRIRYIVQSKNMGANVARNTGLCEANGRFIAYLDDDDEWIETKLALQMGCMDENTAIVCAPFFFRTEKGDVLREISVPENPLSAILEGNYFGPTSFSLLRTDFVRECGGFDVELPRCQEYELWIRLISKYGIRYVDTPVGFYYLSNDSVYRSSSDKYINAIEMILEKHRDLYTANKRAHSNRLMTAARAVMGMRRWGTALKFKFRAMTIDICNPKVWKTWVIPDFVCRTEKFVYKKAICFFSNKH